MGLNKRHSWFLSFANFFIFWSLGSKDTLVIVSYPYRGCFRSVNSDCLLCNKTWYSSSIRTTLCKTYTVTQPFPHRNCRIAWSSSSNNLIKRLDSGDHTADTILILMPLVFIATNFNDILYYKKFQVVVQVKSLYIVTKSLLVKHKISAYIN